MNAQRQIQNFRNPDALCDTLADLPAVKTGQNYVPYQRSQFSPLANLLVTAPQAPVESLAEEFQHTDTRSEQTASLKRQVRHSP